MEILNGEMLTPQNGPPASGFVSVALGNFDGVHLGHTALLRAAREKINGSGVVSVVWTVATPLRAGSGGMILPSAQRLKLLEEAGISYAVLDDYNRRLPEGKVLYDLSPGDFVKTILRDTLHAQRVVCGFNYRFGKEAAGDAALLTSLCRAENIAVTVVPPVRDREGEIISSTRIRAMIEKGDMPGAASLLGRPYALYGAVVSGFQLGRTLDFPTANQCLPPEIVRPRFGVYASTVTLEGKTYIGVTNIGSRPTVNRDGTQAPNAETHLLGYTGNLYGQTLKVELRQYLRGEECFDSPEDLKNAIRRDADAAKALLTAGNGINE